MYIIMRLLSIPLLIIKKLIKGKKSIKLDVKKCVTYIENNLLEINKIPEKNYDILVIAEDHRNIFHLGVDPIAIFRCFYLKRVKGIRQGGSTIEQQYVRTITKRYERTPRRKLREQIISMLLLDEVKDKKLIGLAYIHCAYFGYNQNGFFSVKKVERDNTIELIARLKYPTRKNQSPSNNEKVCMRVKHIKKISSSRAFLPVVR